MAYQVALPRPVKRQLDDLPVTWRNRILETLRDLGDDPRPHGCRKLTNSESWLVRVGDYRVIYKVDDRTKVIIIGWIRLR